MAEDPNTEPDFHLNMTTDQKLEQLFRLNKQLYRFFVGSLDKPGMIQMVKEHDKILNDPNDGVVPWKKEVEGKFKYGIGWIGGALAVGMVVVWIIERVILR
jgi:hypothetical protein